MDLGEILDYIASEKLQVRHAIGWMLTLYIIFVYEIKYLGDYIIYELSTVCVRKTLRFSILTSVQN